MRSRITGTRIPTLAANLSDIGAMDASTEELSGMTRTARQLRTSTIELGGEPSGRTLG
jgi:hypothetical protein